MTQQQRQPLQYFQGSIGQQEDKNTSAESGSKPYKRLELLGLMVTAVYGFQRTLKKAK